MRSKRVRAAQNKGGRRGSYSNDFISQMSDDILLYILSLLPIKDAVITGCLSTRWRFLWCHLIQLNFDASETLDKMAKDRKLCVSERPKYINQVNGVIRSYNRPMVQDFRIRFDLDENYKRVVDKWLQFAVNKRVEMLELDLMESSQKLRHPDESYDFPLRLSDRSVGHRFKWPSSNATVVEIPSLKKLFLKSVNMSEATLQELLTNSPHLETLSIHGAGYLTYVHVGGRSLNLKHFEIAYCSAVESIYLNDFDLVSFAYKGSAIDFDLVDLPKLKELDIGEGVSGLENNVFGQISSCISYLQVLSFNIYRPKESLKLNSIPKLPNVKKLRLTIGARKDDCLLEFTSIAKACPSLEIFAIELLWFSPMKRRRIVRHVANHPHEHLKILEIVGYYGRMSDLELAVYVIDNAVALKKIVIDPHGEARKGTATIKDFLKTEEAARSSAKRQLESLTPRGVELVIL